MNNPLSMIPGYELFPAPQGCTGYRLWRMLDEHVSGGVLRKQYLDRFERRNLVVGVDFDRVAARARAIEIEDELLRKRCSIVLLGEDVRRAFRHEKRAACTPYVMDGMCEFYQVPHPSGRNLWYNEPGNAAKVGRLLARLYNA